MASIIGTSGDDTIAPDGVSAGVTGGVPSDADDTIIGDYGDDTLIGGGGNDLLDAGFDFSDRTANRLAGGAGDDTLFAADASDTLVGGDGIDTADYRYSNIGVHSGDGATINLAAGTITSASGASIVAGVENLTGSSWADRITGSAGANSIDGYHGADSLLGRGGGDDLFGGTGKDADTLRGGAGDDSLTGGAGADRLIGGAGADHFIYGGDRSPRNGGDVIADFQHGVDKIEINGYGPALDSFADLDIRQVSVNAQIFLSTSVHLAGVIILPGMDASQLDATDFLFH